jgi:hypothetical protein
VSSNAVTAAAPSLAGKPARLHRDGTGQVGCYPPGAEQEPQQAPQRHHRVGRRAAAQPATGDDPQNLPGRQRRQRIIEGVPAVALPRAGARVVEALVARI